MNTSSTQPLVMIGAGGHASVLRSLIQAAGFHLIGVCDPALAASGTREWRGLPVLGDDTALIEFLPGSVALVNGVGQVIGSSRRGDAAARLVALGYSFPVLVHPSAWVAEDVVLADGVQVMAGAVIQPGSRIGENTIVNTRAGIDHDCIIGRNVHIAPAATLCGGVRVGDGAFVGSGATIVQGLTVGAHAIAGAGVTLVRDLGERQKILGAPSRPVQEC